MNLKILEPVRWCSIFLRSSPDRSSCRPYTGFHLQKVYHTNGPHCGAATGRLCREWPAPFRALSPEPPGEARWHPPPLLESSSVFRANAGLQPPELELTLAKSTNIVVRLQFGKSPTNDSTQVFARRAGVNAIVTVPRDLLDPWRGTFNQFREPHLVALPTNVAQIEIRGAEPFTLQRNAGNGWRVVGQELPVDAGLVDDLIAALNRLEIVSFKDSITEPDLPTYGLTNPVRQLIVSATGPGPNGGTNVVLAALAFGGTNAGNIFVRRADENPVYAVALADFQNLPAAAWQLRARQLWNFAVGDVTRIVVQQGDRRRELLHGGTNAWVLAPGSSGVLDGVRMTAIEETAHRFGELAATAWVGRGDEHRARLGFGTNGLALTFELKTGAKHQVEFGGLSPENYPYAAVKLDGQTWFFEASLALYQLALYSLALPANVP